MFTSENNDIANQSVDTSFFTSEKKSYDQSAGSSSAKRLFFDAFWCVNLGMIIINCFTHGQGLIDTCILLITGFLFSFYVVFDFMWIS